MSETKIKELEKQVAELLNHKNAVNKVIQGLQEKISNLDKRVTALEQKKNQTSPGPGIIVPV